LSALEQLLIDAKRLVQEQADLAKAFIHNQQRASGLNDLSILPDLCASHREQLIVMRQNHQKVISIRLDQFGYTFSQATILLLTNIFILNSTSN
jgi:RB1-inducible coiled-coil protein 1